MKKILCSKVLCGSEEGTLTIWDLRKPAFPASYYTVHENSSVTDIAFHRDDPTRLFTASEAGELFQWSHKPQQFTEKIDGQLTISDNEHVNPWLCAQRTKSRINVSNNSSLSWSSPAHCCIEQICIIRFISLSFHCS